MKRIIVNILLFLVWVIVTPIALPIWLLIQTVRYITVSWELIKL